MHALQIQILAPLLIGIAASATRAENTGSFYALFFDGSHVSVPAFPEDVWWSDETVLAGRRLFGTQNPVRMLQDMLPCGPLQGPRVLMANGDVLPGKVVGFLPAVPDRDTPARLLVSGDGPLMTADPAVCSCGRTAFCGLRPPRTGSVPGSRARCC